MFSTITRRIIRFGSLNKSSFLTLRSVETAGVLRARALSSTAVTAYPTVIKKATTTKPKPKATTKPKATKKKKPVAVKKRSVKVTPKKKKAPVKRKVVVKRKKAAPKKKVISPRTVPSLRAPLRSISAWALFTKRMYPTLRPAPASVTAGASQLSTMWKALTPAEKKPFEDEVAALNADRAVVYNKWRAGLSLADVRLVNAYKQKHGHNKLGKPATSTRKPAPFAKFYKEAVEAGTIDFAKAPDGKKAVYGVRQASALWKGLSEAEKKKYV